MYHIFNQLMTNLKEFIEMSNNACIKLNELLDITGEDTRTYTACSKFVVKAYEFVKIYVTEIWTKSAVAYLELFIFEHNFGETPLIVSNMMSPKTEYKISTIDELYNFFEEYFV